MQYILGAIVQAGPGSGLEFSVVVFRDDGLCGCGVGGAGEVSGSEFVDRDVEAGA